MLAKRLENRSALDTSLLGKMQCMEGLRRLVSFEEGRVFRLRQAYVKIRAQAGGNIHIANYKKGHSPPIEICIRLLTENATKATHQSSIEMQASR